VISGTWREKRRGYFVSVVPLNRVSRNAIGIMPIAKTTQIR
jgi:hypothetical protein